MMVCSGTNRPRMRATASGEMFPTMGVYMCPTSLQRHELAFNTTREASGSARTMGQCMATGEASGTAAAMCVECGWDDVRRVPVQDLRQALKDQGAVIDGTH